MIKEVVLRHKKSLEGYPSRLLAESEAPHLYFESTMISELKILKF